MIKTPRFNLILARFTVNTYVLVVLPPGESEIECTRLNVLTARDEFSQIESNPDRGREEPADKSVDKSIVDKDGDGPTERRPNGTANPNT